MIISFVKEFKLLVAQKEKILASFLKRVLQYFRNIAHKIMRIPSYGLKTVLDGGLDFGRHMFIRARLSRLVRAVPCTGGVTPPLPFFLTLPINSGPKEELSHSHRFSSTLLLRGTFFPQITKADEILRRLPLETANLFAPKF